MGPLEWLCVGGACSNGWITAGINTMGCYEVAVDTVSPLLLPVDKEKWSTRGRVTFSFKENETSLKGFKGTLDGKFILFEYNSKRKEFTLDLKKEKVQKVAIK